MEWSFRTIIEVGGSVAAVTMTVIAVLWWLLFHRIKDDFATKKDVDEKMKENKLTHEKLSKRMGDVEDQLNDIQANVRQLPKAVQFAEMMISIEKMFGEIKVVHERTDQQNRQLERVERGIDRLTDHHLVEHK